MLKLDRKKFWQQYHKGFDAYGPTTQATVDALNDILDRFETETRLKFVSHYSYALATSYHETGINGNHFVPVKEGRERSTSPRRANQDRYWKTGFYGRGQIQTTHEENYLKLGQGLGVGDMFVKNPDLLLTAEWSYESLVYGMSKGIYRSDSRGKKNLSRYLKSDDASLQDYVNARDIVNGDIKKNGLMIAQYAEKFEHIILASKISATTSNAGPSAAQDELSSNSMDTSGSSSELPPTNPPQAPDQTIVDVPPVVTEKPEGIVSKIKSWYAAAPAALITFLGGVWSWIEGAATEIIVAFFAASALIAMTWIISNIILKNKREARQFEAEQKQKERDFELTKLQMQSAMDPNKQTVRLAPPVVVVPNSEDV